MKNRPTSREFKLLSLTVLLAICGSIGTDIHLASLPHIMSYMHTNRQHMQQSVTFFILGVGLSILVYGPLSDKIGRKSVVIFGLVLACISSYSAAFVQHITPFLILRVLQGVGSGVRYMGHFSCLLPLPFSAIVASFPHLGTSALAISYIVLGLLGFICYIGLVRG